MSPDGSQLAYVANGQIYLRKFSDLTAGHVAYHVDGKLFSGDLLFEQSVGRVDLPGGDWQALLDSVRGLLDRFGPGTEVYPGHGPKTTIRHERRTNPFLQGAGP